MIQKLILLSVFTYTLFAAPLILEKDIKLQYFLKQNNSYKGMFLIEKNKNLLKTKYYNLNKGYKIPFLANEKEFLFDIIDNKMILNTIAVENIQRTFSYDLKTLSEEQRDLIGISPIDIDRRSILFGKDNLPDYTIDKSQIFSVEALLVSLMSDTFDYDKSFYLYEPHKKLLLKVEFNKQNDETVVIDGKTILTNKYLLKVQAKTTKLLYINLTKDNTPVKVSSTKGLWSFELLGAAQMKNHQIDYTKDIRSALTAKSHIGDDLKITSQKYTTNSTNHILTSNVTTSIQNITDSVIAKNINSKSFVKKANANTKEYSVSASDIIKNIEQSEGVVHTENFQFIKKYSKTLTYFDQQNLFVKIDKSCKITTNEDGERILVCADKIKEDFSDEELKNIVHYYLNKQAVQELTISNKMTSSDIEFDYTKRYPFSKNQIATFIKNALKKEIGNNIFVTINNNNIVTSKHSYSVIIDLEKIKQDLCQKKGSQLRAKQTKFDDSVCYINGISSTINIETFAQQQLEKTKNNYPALKWLNLPIKKIDNHTLEFKYIKGYEGLNDASL